MATPFKKKQKTNTRLVSWTLGTAGTYRPGWSGTTWPLKIFSGQTNGLCLHMVTGGRCHDAWGYSDRLLWECEILTFQRSQMPHCVTGTMKLTIKAWEEAHKIIYLRGKSFLPSSPLWLNMQQPHFLILSDLAIWANKEIKTIGYIVWAGKLMTRLRINMCLPTSTFFSVSRTAPCLCVILWLAELSDSALLSVIAAAFWLSAQIIFCDLQTVVPSQTFLCWTV